MATTQKPKLTRFENPQYYSTDVKKCIKQFLIDITRVYTSGILYSEAMSDGAINSSYSYIKSHRDGFRIPALKSFIDYVYTRDEVYNPFGKWLTFEYLEPLQILEFANSLLSEHNLTKYSPITLTAIIFILFQYRNSTSPQILRDLRNKYRTRLNKVNPSINGDKIFAILGGSRRHSNLAILFRKPDYLYNLVGVADIRIFRKYLKFLRIECISIKTKSGQQFQSKLLVGGTELLMNKFIQFRDLNNLRYEEIRRDLDSPEKSGIRLPKRERGLIAYCYNKMLIRDKQIVTIRGLDGNPILKFLPYEQKYRCYMQSSFFDIRFLLGSLYTVANSQRRTLKKPLKRLIGDCIGKQILNATGQFSTTQITETLGSCGAGIIPHSVTSPLNLSQNQHYRQIEESRSIIQSTSEKGILIGNNKLEKLLSKYSTDKPLTDASITGDISDIEDDGYEFIDSADSEKLNLVYNNLLKIKEYSVPVNDRMGHHSRIYGVFTPHGASTHRMTCRSLNLQGIKKEIRREIIVAPQHRCLISADVSGQDITVAANLASRLFSQTELFDDSLREQIEELKVQVETTLEKLSDSSSIKSKPIDFITNQITVENSAPVSSLTREEIRALVKRAVYTLFYGGGKNTFLNSSIKGSDINSILKGLISDCFLIEDAFARDNNIKKRRLILKGNRSSDPGQMIESIDYFIRTFPEVYFTNASAAMVWQVKEDLIPILAQLQELKSITKYRNAESYIFDSFKQILNREYQGILQSFDYYSAYYSANNLTYPTFLGWQTVVSLSIDKGDMLTRSKSYPVQAAGAEFIRQWLIELTRNLPKVLQRKGAFDIINVIHDQVILETSTNHSEIARAHLLYSAKNAASAIGILPNTLHLAITNEL